MQHFLKYLDCYRCCCNMACRCCLYMFVVLHHVATMSNTLCSTFSTMTRSRSKFVVVPKHTPHACPAGCNKSFKTEQGLNHHLSTAKSCRWYRKGKLVDHDSQRSEDKEEDDYRPEEVLAELHEDLFCLVPADLGMFCP
jgi:hypothetical protein